VGDWRERSSEKANKVEKYLYLTLGRGRGKFLVIFLKV
jgi:hypothetical protein